MFSCKFCLKCFYSPPNSPSTGAMQFFEAIDPLNGFDDKESFETYMWDQSLKIEPKDSDKMEILKPIRAAHVIRSPGIKPPKVLNTPASTSGGPSNHYAGYRGSGRGFTSHFNTYSSAEPNNALQTSLSTNVVANEEKSSHLGIVEINPGYQPRYLGDARRGRYPPALSLVKPPPLSSPRTRKDKASSTPPSPRGQPAVISPNDPPPPLYPRRMSPHFFPPTSFAHRCVSDLHPSTTGSSTITNVCSPTPVTTASLISVGHTMELSTSASPNDLEEGESHDDVVDVFGVTTSNQDHLIDTQDTMIPQVPPRKKADILPAPLSPDTIRVVLDGEMDQKSKTTDRLSIAEKQPQLYPRRVNFEPPPRPPKTKLLQNRIAFEPVQTCDNGEESGKCSPPPPLPPKTYKRRQL